MVSVKRNLTTLLDYFILRSQCTTENICLIGIFKEDEKFQIKTNTGKNLPVHCTKIFMCQGDINIDLNILN